MFDMKSTTIKGALINLLAKKNKSKPWVVPHAKLDS